MTITFTYYDKYKENIFDCSSTVAFGTDTIKVGLVSSSYTPASSDEFWSTPVSNEMSSGGGYTTGGATTTATVSGGTTTTSKVVLSDVTWSQNASGFTTARYAVVYKSTGTGSTSELIGYYNFGADKGNVTGDLTISFDATNGAFSIT